MNDVQGIRCADCDPIVQATTFGTKNDPFLLMIETVKDGKVERHIVPKPFPKFVQLQLDLK